MAGMSLNTLGWTISVALGVALLFLHIPPGNLNVVRLALSFTLCFGGGRELLRIHKNAGN